MGLHDFIFFRGQSAGFIQDSVGNGYLADIVHDGSQCNLFNFFFGKTFSQFGAPEQKTSDIMNTLDVFARFTITEFNSCLLYTSRCV